MATLTVGTNRQYATIAAALAAARDGDTVAVATGLYLNDFGTVRTKVTLTAVGGNVTLLATTALAPGKAILTVTTDATIDGFVFAGAKASDGTAAGLLDTGGALVVRNSLFVGNQTGLLVRPATNGSGSVTVQGSEFDRNGAGDGFSGNINVGAVSFLTIQDSFIHDARNGDEVKSLALATTITGTRILDSTVSVSAGGPISGGASGFATSDVNLPRGGVIKIQNSIIEKGPDTTGPAIRVGGDTSYPNTSITVSGTYFLSDQRGATVLQNTTGATASVNNNQFYGFGTIASGPAVVSSNTFPPSRPPISTTPLVVPASALPVEYGRAGAVIANGTVRTVGPAGQFATLKQALAVARDGDTIRVTAGTYIETDLVIGRKVIIEGVGGMARIVAGGPPANGLALITTTTNVTLRNIEVTGAAVVGGVVAAIRDQGGNLTLVNSYVHDNQAGIVADRGVSGNVGIYDSELARNGTVDGRGLNLDVAEVGSLTLRNSWIHESPSGFELRSRADNTVVDGTRVLQTMGSGAYAVDLPNSGRVTIGNSVIEKGIGSLGGALLHVGGDSTYPGSIVSVASTTLISNLTTSTTRFVVAEPGAGYTTLTGVGFEGGIAGSVQATGATNNNPVTRTGLTIAGNAPWGTPTAPAPGALTVASPSPTAPSRGVMTVRISEDAYRGDAQFRLTVDGTPVGDVLKAAAAHGSGLSQSFTITGLFAPGPHVVGVSLVNDLASGAPGEDRNLYIDGFGFNGTNYNRTAVLTANGTTVLTTGPVTRPTPVVVSLSEDAYRGDALAFVTIDGKLQGDLVTVTAAHAAGKTQAMNFLLDLAPGGHTVGVTFLNDDKSGAGQSRNLYIDSIDIAGAHVPRSAATVLGSATTVFGFEVAPPPVENGSLFVYAGVVQPLALMPPLG